MTTDRQVGRLRPTPLLATAAVMQVAAIVLYAVNLPAQRLSPAWGFVPAAVVALLTAVACRQTARAPGLGPVPARLWRSIGWVCLLAGLGTIGDARQSVTHPERVTQQQHDLATSICYVLAVVVLLWALLRLPIGRRGATTRFVLDALTISVTVGVFA